jgi:hypothetical protein
MEIGKMIMEFKEAIQGYDFIGGYRRCKRN